MTDRQPHQELITKFPVVHYIEGQREAAYEILTKMRFRCELRLWWKVEWNKQRRAVILFVTDHRCLASNDALIAANRTGNIVLHAQLRQKETNQ